MTANKRKHTWYLPWRTCLLAGVSLLLYLFTPLTEMAVYDRSLIQAGELWRLLSGHLVHFSVDHLAYNLMFLLVAGYILERRNPRFFLVLTILSALTISLGLLLFNPHYTQYGGLSGIASAYLVYYASIRIQSEKWNAWPWIALVLLFIAKIAIEALQGSAVFVNDTTFQITPAAHLTGALVGILFVIFKSPRSPDAATA